MNHSLCDVIREQADGLHFLSDAVALGVAGGVHVAVTVADAAQDIRGVVIGAAALAARTVVLILGKWLASKFPGTPGKRARRTRASKNGTGTAQTPEHK